jgi:hypothetical protein
MNPTEPEKRSTLSRILFALLWLIPFWLLINMIIGAVVGLTTVTATADFQTAKEAGARASREFFFTYGGIVYPLELLAWLLLSIFGVLPGTSRLKSTRGQKTGPDRK